MNSMFSIVRCIAAMTNRFRLHRLAVFLFLCPALAFSNANRLQDVPLPQNVTAKAVALNVVQHGHRMSMATLVNAYPVDEIIDFYRQEWAEPVAPGLPGYIEDQSGDVHIISRLEDGWNTVVQLRTHSKGIDAFVSVLELEPVSDGAYAQAAPRDAVVVSSTSGEEFGKPTQTDIIFSRNREGVVSGFYRNHFSENQWDIVSDRHIQGSTVLIMQRSGAQAEVVVTPADNGSFAVINRVGNYD